MNGLQLKLSRELLGLSQQEAAEHIGKVSQRSWAFWESGRTPVKEDVVKFVKMLLSRRNQVIQEFKNLQKDDPAQKVVIVYYDTPEYCQSYLEWRFSQSLARTLAVDFNVALVKFDKHSFDEYCKGFNLTDTPAARSEWAVFQHSAKGE